MNLYHNTLVADFFAAHLDEPFDCGEISSLLSISKVGRQLGYSRRRAPTTVQVAVVLKVMRAMLPFTMVLRSAPRGGRRMVVCYKGTRDELMKYKEASR